MTNQQTHELEKAARPEPPYPAAPAKPYFDYINYPFSPRTGWQSVGNKKFLRKALFIETSDLATMQYVRYTLQEHEVYNPWTGVWLPSAWLIVVNAIDDYDAMRKLVGSPKHWKDLHELSWFPEWLEECLNEQAAFQRMAVRKVLLTLAESDEAKEALPACKSLLSMIDKRQMVTRGRPPKAREADPTGQTSANVDSDHARVTKLFASGAT